VLAGKEDMFTWLAEKLFGKALFHFGPTWIVAGLVIIGAVIWLIEAHVPEAEKERTAGSIDGFVGRVFASLLLGILGGVCGGIAWSILARNIAAVDSAGGEAGPGIAAIISAVIAACAAFAMSRPSRS
jgi:MFS superfamily sulfate permease-like transporter